jgi:hypothetical protein
MPIAIKAYANADDVLIAWSPDKWDPTWVGFKLERRDERTKSVTVINNRIPPKPGGGAVEPAGIDSGASPIRRCLWTDHGVAETDTVAYRVTPMKESGAGFVPDTAAASAWTATETATGAMGDGIEAYFNRGTLMSQVVTRFVKEDTSLPALRKFVSDLDQPGFAARRYLSGDVRTHILGFLSEADRRGSSVYAALYEVNDHELVEGLMPFGNRGHVLLGNGGATQPWVATSLEAAGLEVRHRDLSHHGESSPSVHNKFVVEVAPDGTPLRVLSGSTNWTVTGLCTQLNNVIFVEKPEIAARFRDQWTKLTAAGDDMTDALRASNSTSTVSGPVEVFFTATSGEVEFAPVKKLIAEAKQGVLTLMFMPGNSPLLQAVLDRAKDDDIYVRGVISSVAVKGQIVKVGSQVIKSGGDPMDFHQDVIVPGSVPAANRPTWAEQEFTVGEINSAGMRAIVHSKVIVVDPFSDACAVITGSHNFSDGASKNNDENLIIVRGNKTLAQAYALHITGVYDSYSWRAFLGGGGKPDDIYKPLDGWQPGGHRYRELAFWLGIDAPPAAKPKRSGRKGAPAKSGKPAKKAPSAKGGKGRKPAAKKGGAHAAKKEAGRGRGKSKTAAGRKKSGAKGAGR